MDSVDYIGDKSLSMNRSSSGLLIPKGGARQVEHRVIDRTFTDLGYIGYGDGIDLELLDSTGNWQFES